MLNSKTARSFVERIEVIRASASHDEAGVLSELRKMPDYETNQDKDILEAIKLRADANAALSDAETLIGAFDFAFDEVTGETVPKDQGAGHAE